MGERTGPRLAVADRSTDPYAWRCHVDTDWNTGEERLHLVRRTSGGDVLVVTGFDDEGRPVVDRFQIEAAAPATPAMRLDPDMLAAVAARLNPGPSQGEVRRLEEALAVERARVDLLLARIARTEAAR